MYRWPPTHRLLAARFSADLEQLQNWDFATSNCSKTIGVLTRTKCSCSDDHLPIGYLLPDFQLIWNNFKIEIFELQIVLSRNYRYQRFMVISRSKTGKKTDIKMFFFDITTFFLVNVAGRNWFFLKKTVISKNKNLISCHITRRFLCQFPPRNSRSKTENTPEKTLQKFSVVIFFHLVKK